MVRTVEAQAGEDPAAAGRPRFAAGWTGRLAVALVAYAVLAIAWTELGLGGERVTYYVSLGGDMPASLMAVVLAWAAAAGLPPGELRRGWRLFAWATTLYCIAGCISAGYWLVGVDPFPSVADVFYLAFYPLTFAAVGCLLRAAAVRIAWRRLALDATIFAVGFGAFFWYLVLQPASAVHDVDLLRQALSQAYLALNCVLLLTAGVLLISGGGGVGRRTLLLLTGGFAAMFLADVVWALTKIGGDYLPGGLSDHLYVTCYVLLGLAARSQLLDAAAPAAPPRRAGLAQFLPHVAMLLSFLALVALTDDQAGGPANVMTAVLFVLTVLVMLRQGVVLRDEAAERERRAAGLVEARFASVIRNASDVVMIAGADGRLRFVSAAAERVLGRAPAELAGHALQDLWSGDERERMATFLADLVAAPGGVLGPLELPIARGAERATVECVGHNLLADSAVEGLALNLRDISERKALEQQLRQLAFHDPLTLLANRNLFRDRVQHALLLAQRGQQRIAVMFLDLDNFKNVNDTLGHGAGDRLLQAAAQRIVRCTRASDTVARLGGDEFAVLLEGVGDGADVERVASAIIAALGAPFPLGEADGRVAASVGVAFSQPQDSAEELLRNADIAMYNAKARGKDRYAVFQPQMQEVLRERLRIEAEIGRALARGEFFLEFQPVVDLVTRGLLGVEALVRWRHPQRGVVMPGQFIQVAEESGQIVELGRWVLLEACRRVRRWRDAVAGGAGLRVSVNISGRHLQHADLVGDVAEALRESGLEPGNLVIELTESVIMHNTEANLARLHQLKALGVRLAIDDFGTGYSSLAYLHRFPIDVLKIDRSFVSRLTSDDDGPELARAVVTLGDTLGLETVAEGIEQEPQVGALLGLGCVAGQGFLFSPATALDALTASPFATRRAELWAERSADDPLTATGRYAARLARARSTAA